MDNRIGVVYKYTVDGFTTSQQYTLITKAWRWITYVLIFAKKQYETPISLSSILLSGPSCILSQDMHSSPPRGLIGLVSRHIERRIIPLWKRLHFLWCIIHPLVPIIYHPPPHPTTFHLLLPTRETFNLGRMETWRREHIIINPPQNSSNPHKQRNIFINPPQNSYNSHKQRNIFIKPRGGVLIRTNKETYS
jgi:hypothetical protein